MAVESSDKDGPEAVESAFWYWLAILIFLFMAVFVVMALIETHAQ